jgi:hypothetical protein
MDCFAALAMTVIDSRRKRSPDERSDIRGLFAFVPGYRFAHPGYVFPVYFFCA